MIFDVPLPSPTPSRAPPAPSELPLPTLMWNFCAVPPKCIGTTVPVVVLLAVVVAAIASGAVLPSPNWPYSSLYKFLRTLLIRLVSSSSPSSGFAPSVPFFSCPSFTFTGKMALLTLAGILWNIQIITFCQHSLVLINFGIPSPTFPLNLLGSECKCARVQLRRHQHKSIFARQQILVGAGVDGRAGPESDIF